MPIVPAHCLGRHDSAVITLIFPTFSSNANDYDTAARCSCFCVSRIRRLVRRTLPRQFVSIDSCAPVGEDVNRRCILIIDDDATTPRPADHQLVPTYPISRLLFSGGARRSFAPRSFYILPLSFYQFTTIVIHHYAVSFQVFRTKVSAFKCRGAR